MVRPAVPVSAARATRGNLNLYLTAIGNVTPFNTTTVKSRVDGAIQKIFYKEGQNVKEGDLLIQIDPRPYQVQLAQAQGQLAKDEAAYEDGKNLPSSATSFCIRRACSRASNSTISNR